MRKKALVTGGAGFIGSHLTRKLVNEGYKVIVIDNLCEGRLENIQDILSKIKFYKRDILDYQFLKKVFKNVDFIFYQAALRSVSKSVENPSNTNKINTEGTLNVLLAARENKIKRIIFASSSSIYGEQKAEILKETLCPNPLSPYALSKLAGEFYMKQFSQLYSLQTISLRYFNVFGPFQDPTSEYAAVIPIFITKMLRNQRPIIHWDGNQLRNFTYIDNVIDANILAVKVKETHGEVINVCENKTISINQLFKAINQILGRNIRPKRAPKRPGDVRRTLGDVSLPKKTLKYKVS